ncbi:uncharacterized protein LOC143028660 isoform X2 [Oratosquilla oratoria]|uniref:uncharacterized protein LOC143028660 isoform X2 n=1 Tax=Oratosquilla oratoria TaxID=337810 RepID=UPI003F7581C3
MSWLGVNINDSLNSLKGQLSNFTKEVLTESIEEVDDNEAEVFVSRDRIRELESLCQLQKHELDQMKGTRAELEERLQAADLHAAHQTATLKEQLRHKEAELAVHKEKSGWSWNDVDLDNDDEGLTNHKPRLHHEDLSSRVQQLEEQLLTLRDRHQDEVAALQNQHRQQLDAHRRQQQQQQQEQTSVQTSSTSIGGPTHSITAIGSTLEGAVPGIGGGEAGPSVQGHQGVQQRLDQVVKDLEKTVKSRDDLAEQNQLLQRQLEEAKKSLQNLAHEKCASQSEDKVAQLKLECAQLQQDKQKYISSLEELDAQHQEVISHILKKKEELQKEINVTKSDFIEQSKEVGQLKESLKVQQEENLKHCQEISKLQEELQVTQQKEECEAADEKQMISQLLEAKEHLRRTLEEVKGSLKESQEEVKTKNYTLEHTVQELEHVQGKVKHEETVKEHLEGRVQGLEKELKKVMKQSEEAQSRDSELNEEIAKLKGKLEESETVRLGLEREKQKMEGLTQRVLEAEEAKKHLKTSLESIQNEKEVWQQSVKQLNDTIQQMKAETSEVSTEATVALEKRNAGLEEKLDQFIKERAKEEEDMKKALGTSYDGLAPSNGGIGQFVEALRDATWKKSTLERKMVELSKELRQSNSQLEEYKCDKMDLENECSELKERVQELLGDLQAQREEFTVRGAAGLPTIDEEEEDERGLEERREGDEPDDRHNNVAALKAQIDALSEARGNLEMEAATLRSQKDDLQHSLNDLEGRTGNLVNLEVEVNALRRERDSLQDQLDNLAEAHQTLRDQLYEKEEAVSTYKYLEDEKAALESQIRDMQSEANLQTSGAKELEETNLEKEATIEVLESEIQGLRTALREQQIKSQSHDERAKAALQESLDKVKTELIYKSDQYDEYFQIIQEIGDIFGNNHSNPDELTKLVRESHQALNEKISEKEKNIATLNCNVADLNVEVDKWKKQVIMMEAESVSSIAEKERELGLAKESSLVYKEQVQALSQQVERLSLNSDSEHLEIQQKLKAVETEKDQLYVIMNQKTEELGFLRQENNRLMDVVTKEKALFVQLQGENEDLMAEKDKQARELTEMNKEAMQKLSKLVRDKEQDLEARELKISELEAKIQGMTQEKDSSSQEVSSFCQKNSMLENEKTNLLQDKEKLHQEYTTLKTEKESLSAELARTQQEKESIFQQLTAFQTEREQMVAALTQKHQESLSYHAEIQKLSLILTQENEKMAEERKRTQQELEASHAAAKAAASKVGALEGLLEHSQKDLEKLKSAGSRETALKLELTNLYSEMEVKRKNLATVEQERDQLRVANGQFNSQYTDQSKELTTLRDKEARLSAECERLRKHLVSIEESYTAEALRAEERENTLRTTLSKMEEKLNNHSSFYNSASQRASVQVVTLQEQLRECATQKEDALMRLHTAEEAAEQNQAAVDNLQRVLHDFQKGQARDIADAVSREKRLLEEEKEKSTTLTTQIQQLKAQLAEVQNGIAAASRLGEQLERKEQAIVALKNQLASNEALVNKARDEVACLKTNSEAKVDKHLVRNLLVGYFATQSDKQPEVLRIIATVLDFSPEERIRTGLDSQGSSWFNSISNFLAPPATNLRVTSKVDVLDHKSLSQAFIRFLEDESSPRPIVKLPAVEMAKETEEKAEKKVQAKAQAKINPFVSVGTPSEGNNNSRNNSPLLAAASTTPTLPTFTPLTPASKTAALPTFTSSYTPTSTESLTGPQVSTPKFLSNLLGSEEAKDENMN